MLGCIQRRDIRVVVPGQHVIQYLSDDVWLVEAERGQELPGVGIELRWPAGPWRTPGQRGPEGRRRACLARSNGATWAPSSSRMIGFDQTGRRARSPGCLGACHNAGCW